MPCLYCNASFSIIKWKKKCDFCTNQFCTNCIVQKRCLACANVLNCQWIYESLMKVKTKDLKLYLSVRGTPIHLYTEKTELVRLVLMKEHSNKNLGSRSNRSTPHQPRQNPAQGNLESGQSTSTQSNRHGNSQQETHNLRNEEQSGFSNGARNASGLSTTIPESTHSRQVEEAAGRSLFMGESGDGGNSDNQEGIDSQASTVKRPTPTGLANKIIIGDIKSPDQIELLATRELKQILFDNFIEYKGCVEKIELQTRVHNLYNEKEKAKQDSEKHTTDDSDLCKICWDGAIDCVLLDCGHMATCTSCGKRLNECPICRQFIVRCVHVFKS